METNILFHHFTRPQEADQFHYHFESESEEFDSDSVEKEMEGDSESNNTKKDWTAIESDFIQKYKTGKAISFDFGDGPSHDLRPEQALDLLHIIGARGGSCPFDKFHVGVFTKHVKELLEVAAPVMRHLWLAHWGDRDFFTETEVPKRMDFRNLKSLNVKLVVDDDEEVGYDATRYFNFIEGVLRGSKSLFTLSCNFPGFWDGMAMEQFLRAIVRSEMNLKTVTSMDLSGCFIPTHFLILSGLGMDDLQLKKLSVKFCGFLTKASAKPVRRFLQTQSKSLEFLEIEDTDSTSDCFVSFPQMRQLAEMKISGSFLGGTGIRFQGINYQRQFPVLRKLTFNRLGENEWKSFILEPSSPCMSLKRLHILDSSEGCINVKDAKVRFLFPVADLTS